MASPAPIYELAGQQDDPLAERVLALLFTDQPVRKSVSADTRRHWQWFARTDVENRGSRLWLTAGEPITDDTVALMADRAQSALAVLTKDGTASDIRVTVTQTAFDAVDLHVEITTPAGRTATVDVALEQGGS